MNKPSYSWVLVFLVAVCASCDSAGEPRGPLAAIADSVIRQGTECTNEDVWPLLEAPTPLRVCRGSIGDTTLLVVSDASDTTHIVMRSWPAGPNGVERYAEMVVGLQRLYGEGVTVSPPLPGHPDWQRTLWAYQTHHLSLLLMPSQNTIDLEWRLETHEH